MLAGSNYRRTNSEIFWPKPRRVSSILPTLALRPLTSALSPLTSLVSPINPLPVVFLLLAVVVQLSLNPRQPLDGVLIILAHRLIFLAGVSLGVGVVVLVCVVLKRNSEEKSRIRSRYISRCMVRLYTNQTEKCAYCRGN